MPPPLRTPTRERRPWMAASGRGRGRRRRQPREPRRSPPRRGAQGTNGGESRGGRRRGKGGMDAAEKLPPAWMRATAPYELESTPPPCQQLPLNTLTRTIRFAHRSWSSRRTCARQIGSRGVDRRRCCRQILAWGNDQASASRRRSTFFGWSNVQGTFARLAQSGAV